MLVTITATRMPTKCPACLDHLAAGPIIVRCGECKTPHHGECLTEIGCASLTCTATSAPGANTFAGNPGFIPEGLLDTHPNPLASAIGEGNWYSANYDVGIGAWSLPCVASGTYADLLSRCNYATLAAEFGGDPCTCELTGRDCDAHPGANTESCSFWHNGTFQVLGTPCACAEDNEPWDCEQRAVETMEALENYPVLDDSLHSEAEIHDQDEQWDSWGRADMLRELETRTGLESDGVLSTQGDALRDLAQDETQEYPEGGDDNLSFPYVDWAQHLAQDLDVLRAHGFTDPLVDQHLTPRQTLTFSNVIGAEIAARSLPAGLEGKTLNRAIVRAAYGEMHKANRRRIEGRWTRRLVYRVALDYYKTQPEGT